VPAGEGERAIGEETAQDRDGLEHALDPDARPVEGEPGGLVFGLVPAGPDPDHQSPLAEQVQRGQILGEDGRVAQVVVEHERTQAEAFRGHRHGRQDRDRRELSGQMVVDTEMAVAHRLGEPRALHQGPAIHDRARPDHELEGPHRRIFADRWR
jgi:hypothetical protein